jgi:hypothetical protein
MLARKSRPPEPLLPEPLEAGSRLEILDLLFDLYAVASPILGLATAGWCAVRAPRSPLAANGFALEATGQTLAAYRRQSQR